MQNMHDYFMKFGTIINFDYFEKFSLINVINYDNFVKF